MLQKTSEQIIRSISFFFHCINHNSKRKMEMFCYKEFDDASFYPNGINFFSSFYRTTHTYRAYEISFLSDNLCCGLQSRT